MQSWHCLDLLSYALALRMIAHLMLCGLSCAFNFQKYLLSSVLLRLFECRKVVLWPLNRSLKTFLVRPMYVSFEPSSSVVTVAWYMTDFVRHWALSGQSAGFLQLQLTPGQWSVKSGHATDGKNVAYDRQFTLGTEH